MKQSRRFLIPATPFQRRMMELGRAFPPPPSHPCYEFLSRKAELWAERDMAFRLWLQEVQKKLPSFVLTRMKGGTQLPIANLLREYFQEYASRITNHGAHSFPTSFNVIESFLIFSHDYFVFDIREEKEHLLCLQDFFEWITSGVALDEPRILTDIMQEGLIYSYNMCTPARDYKIQIENSELVLSGVALVRHSTEISMFALCGELLEYPPDDGFFFKEEMRPTNVKKNLKPHPDLSSDDRYLKEVPGYSRVIALVRFDLKGRRYYVRYLARDFGNRYLINTDDPSIFTDDISEEKRKNYLETSNATLERYGPLYSSLVSLMFLPAFFVAQSARVAKTKFSTELHSRRRSVDVRKAIRLLPRNSLRFSRNVYCLESNLVGVPSDEHTIVPPEFEVAAKGFWKSLSAVEVGEDENGNPIVGRTWVQRTDTWSQHGVDKFVIRKRENQIHGPNPGYLYIMRSISHSVDVYKIGKTGRNTEIRARELSAATGVPTDFEVVFRWEVGDIDLVEEETHRKLKPYRINRKREFFRCPLQTIITTIDSIVNEVGTNEGNVK